MKEKDNNLYFKKLEIPVTYKLIENGDAGFTAKIYRYSDKELLKIFKYKLDENHSFKFDILSKINTEYFAFPNKKVYIGNKLKGYSVYYKDGILLDDLEDININNLLKSILKLNNDFLELAEKHIRVIDLHNKNILYNEINNDINIIDTSEYVFSPKMHSSDLYKFNCRSLIYNICVLLNVDINEFDYNNTTSIYKFCDLLKEKINKLEYENNKDIIRLKELKLIKKNK